MPRHGSVNPAGVRANAFFVFPPDIYKFRITGLKPFTRTKEDNTESFGVRLNLECAEGEYTGKKCTFSCFLQTEGGQGIAKGLQMAAYGFNPKDKDAEGEFDTIALDLDWSFDTDSGEVGDGWAKMEGQLVIGEFGVKMYQGKEQQAFNGWQPA